MRCLIFLITLIVSNVSYAYCNWEYTEKTRTEMTVINKYNSERMLTVTIGGFKFDEYVRRMPKEYIISLDNDVLHIYFQGYYFWVTRENTTVARAFGAVHTALIFRSKRSGIAEDIGDLYNNCNF